MFKRIISCLIIFSMLWIDIAAAMDDEDNLPPSSPISSKRTSSDSPSKGSTRSSPPTENSCLLGEGNKRDAYRSLTRMDEIPVPHHSINGTKETGSSSSDDDRGTWIASDLEDSLEKSGVCKTTCSCRLLSLLSCCKKKPPPLLVDEENVEFSGEHRKTGCWPSCCKKNHSLVHREDDVESSREHEHLFVVDKGPSLTELKKQLLLRLVVPSEHPSEDSHLTDVIHVEELGEQDVLAQKARFLFSKIQGTSLEDFGRFHKGHVVENRYRWQDWAGLLVALGMAAGTGNAMAPIVEWSIYNKFLVKHLKEYRPFVMPLAYYIIGSTGVIALTDSTSLMREATAPPTRTFTVHKSAREKIVDGALIALALLPGFYLLFLGFQVQQYHKKFTNTTGWWNEYDRFWYGTSIGFFPYLVAQTWTGMRAAVSKRFHPTIPEHVREDVLALRQLEARLDEHLSDHEVHELFTFFNDPLFAQNASKLKKWSTYCFKGELSDTAKVEGILNYLCLTKYANDNFQESEEDPQTCCAKKSFASRIMSGLGTPAGFGVIAVSLYGLLEAFMDPIPALTLSLTGAALGFLPGALLQSHTLEEALDAIQEGIVPYLKGKCGALKDTLIDPYAWGRGAGRVWAFFQNALTNLAPILVSLTMLIPEYLGGSDTTQTTMTGVMLGLAIPYVISEMINGTIDISRHAITIFHFTQDVYQTIKKFVTTCCCRSTSTSSADYERRWLKKRIQQTISTTLRFTPSHKESLDNLQSRLNGEEEF